MPIPLVTTLTSQLMYEERKHAMRIRALAAVTTAATATAIGGAIAAGNAAAVTPIADPGDGVIGVGFNHAETAALSSSPVPGLLGIGLLAPVTAVHVDPHSSIPRQHGQILADMPTIWRDAAAASAGKMMVALVDPTRYGGKAILVAQIR